MSSWRKNGQDLAQTSRKWRKKISNGESDGERKIYPNANPERVPTIYVLSKNKKKINIFLLKIFNFYNFPKIYISHGHVFVMDTVGLKMERAILGKL